MNSVEFEVNTKFGPHKSRLEFADSATQGEIDLAIKKHVDDWVASIEKNLEDLSKPSASPSYGTIKV